MLKNYFLKPDRNMMYIAECRKGFQAATFQLVGADKFYHERVLDQQCALIASYINAVATCNLNNTPEWMEYLVERTNEILPKIGSTDRVQVSKQGNIQIVKGK